MLVLWCKLKLHVELDVGLKRKQKPRPMLYVKLKLKLEVKLPLQLKLKKFKLSHEVGGRRHLSSSSVAVAKTRQRPQAVGGAWLRRALRS